MLFPIAIIAIPANGIIIMAINANFQLIMKSSEANIKMFIGSTKSF